MNINFTKMHGLGNDFVVIDAIAQKINLTADQIRFIADRHFGIGCDQLLLVEKTECDGVDFRYRIFNADGGEVEQCGNGARCFARFVRDKGLSDKTQIRVETQSGIIALFIDSNDDVTVDMGTPHFEPAALPMITDMLDQAHVNTYGLTIDNKKIEFGAVSVGNPHAVLQVDDISNCQLESLGPMLESHVIFPQRVNVGFMQVMDSQHIKLRVYERGVGETKACGTGACAAVLVAQQWGLVENNVQVQLSGGSLQIKHEQGGHVFLIGDAVTVFDGQITI